MDGILLLGRLEPKLFAPDVSRNYVPATRSVGELLPQSWDGISTPDIDHAFQVFGTDPSSETALIMVHDHRVNPNGSCAGTHLVRQGAQVHFLATNRPPVEGWFGRIRVPALRIILTFEIVSFTCDGLGVNMVYAYHKDVLG